MLLLVLQTIRLVKVDQNRLTKKIPYPYHLRMRLQGGKVDLHYRLPSWHEAVAVAAAFDAASTASVVDAVVATAVGTEPQRIVKVESVLQSKSSSEALSWESKRAPVSGVVNVQIESNCCCYSALYEVVDCVQAAAAAVAVAVAGPWIVGTRHSGG